MIKVIGTALAGGLLLAACTPEEVSIVRQQYKYVDIPRELLNCPILTQYPDPDSLTDRQVAKLLVRISKNNRQCRESMNAVIIYMAKAKLIVER